METEKQLGGKDKGLKEGPEFLFEHTRGRYPGDPEDGLTTEGLEVYGRQLIGTVGHFCHGRDS